MYAYPNLYFNIFVDYVLNIEKKMQNYWNDT